MTVTATGDGPLALTTEETPAAEESVSGRFIVGPGGCLAMTRQDQPQLLVFSDDADFTLRGDRPSATGDAFGTIYVGDRTTLEVTESAKSDVDGIPERCDQGSAETVLVVSE